MVRCFLVCASVFAFGIGTTADCSAQGSSMRGSSSMRSPSAMRSMSRSSMGSGMRSGAGSMRSPSIGSRSSLSSRVPSTAFRAPSRTIASPSSLSRSPSSVLSTRSLSTSRYDRYRATTGSRIAYTRGGVSPLPSSIYGSRRGVSVAIGVRPTVGATIPRRYIPSRTLYPYGSDYYYYGLGSRYYDPYRVNPYSVYSYGSRPSAYIYTPLTSLRYQSVTAPYRDPLPSPSTYIPPYPYPSYDEQAYVDSERRLAELERQRAAGPLAPAENVSRADLGLGPTLLASSLRRLDDAEVWLEYLQPEKVAKAVQRGDVATLKSLSMNYTGVSTNRSLRRISSLPGFAETRQLLAAFAESSVVTLNPAQVQQAEESLTEPGNAPSILETPPAPVPEPTPAAKPKPADKEASKVEELPVPVPAEESV